MHYHWQHRFHTFLSLIWSSIFVFGLFGCGDVNNAPPPDPGPGPLTIVTTALPQGTKDQPYATIVGGTGGITPYLWSLAAGSPAMPAGLNLDAATGAITGVPTSTGITPLVFRLMDDSNPAQAVEKALPITIGTTPQPLAITTKSIPNGYVNQPYPPTTVQATGGTLPYIWSVNPALPNGLFFNLLSPGTISGTPLSGTTGTTSHTFTVTDSTFPFALSDTQTLSLKISGTVPPVTITTPFIDNGKVGRRYSFQLQGSGGIMPYIWSVTPQLPTGLSLNSSTGEIAGTPAAGTAGKSDYTFTLKDSKLPTPQSTSKVLSLEIRK